MSLLTSIPIIGKIFDKTMSIIDKVVPDKDLQAKIKSELAQADYSLLAKELDVQAEALATELIGSDAQRNWRPHLMYLIMFFLFWLIVIVPGLSALGIDLPVKEALDSVPSQMWTLITTGVGGYTVMRSGEKMLSSWVKGKGK